MFGYRLTWDNWAIGIAVDFSNGIWATLRIGPLCLDARTGALTLPETQAVMELRRQFAEYVRELPIDASDYVTVDGSTQSQTIDPETGEIRSDASQIPF